MRYSTFSSNKLEINILRARATGLLTEWYMKNSSAVFSRLYFVEEGRGTISTKDKTFPIEANHVYLIPPECVITTDCDRLKKVFFHIMLPTIEGYDLLQDAQDVFVMPCSDDLLKKLRAYATSDNYYDMLALNNIVLSTLMDFQETFSIPMKDHVR